MLNNNSKLLLTPLILATTVAFANWGSDPEEINANNVSANDEDRAAFIDLSKMVAAGDLEGLQSQGIQIGNRLSRNTGYQDESEDGWSAATDQARACRIVTLSIQ